RLFGYGHRARANVRHQAAAELRVALSIDQYHRLLASLAYDVVAIPARLCLHSARRQPARSDATLPQSDDCHVGGGTLARRRLELRGLGWPARAVPLGQPRLARLGRASRGATLAGKRRVPTLGLGRHFCRGCRRVGLFPSGDTAHRAEYRPCNVRPRRGSWIAFLGSTGTANGVAAACASGGRRLPRTELADAAAPLRARLRLEHSPATAAPF